MSGLVPKPKIPAPTIAAAAPVAEPPPVTELPDPDDPLARARKRRGAAQQGQERGFRALFSTIASRTGRLG